MRKIHLYITFISLCFASQVSFAIPVRMKHIILEQPDGKQFEAIINGDEFASTITDAQGRAIIKNTDGYYCYALYNTDGSKYSTGYLVGEETPAHILEGSKNIPQEALKLNASIKRRNIATETQARPGILRRLRLSQNLMTKSEVINKSCIILLVQFRDKSFKYTKPDFTALVSQKGYSANGGTGCIEEYFSDQFKGDYSFKFTISDIITLDNTCGYYFSDSGNDKDAKTHLAVKEACKKADAQGIDFSQFDDDGDGEVDNVFLFVAGRDQADGGGEDCVWSHQYYLRYTPSSNVVIDGKKINCYAVTTELRRGPGNTFPLTGIGVFCHEYSHTFGLPDFYDTDGAASGGQGNGLWATLALMDSGNSNNNTNTPPNYNAIDYDMLGLGSPKAVTAGSHSLEPISKSRSFLKMETGNSGEYYLIECRDNKGWDKYIGGKGLLIYHIDKSQNQAGYSDTYNENFTAAKRWEYNEVNARPSHQCARLISATPGISAYTPDGYYANNSRQVFFPSFQNNSFSATTDPAFVFWDGTESPIAITDISFNGDNVEFNIIRTGGISLPHAKIGNVDVFQDAAIIQWQASDPTFTSPAYISYGKSGSEQQTIEVSPYEVGKYAAILENLSPRTAYKTEVFFKEGGLTGQKVSANFTTKSLHDVEPYIFFNGISRNKDGSFPKKTKLPLRVYNLREASVVQWYMDGTKINVSGSGYYELNSSGDLKAVITYKDGSKDIIQKTIIVK